MSWAPHELAALSGRLDALLALPEAEQEAWLVAQPDAARLRALLAREAEGQLATLAGTGESAPRDWLGHEGERVGPYRLIAPLGRGGMGEVWRAARADGSFEREVALKRPQAEGIEGGQADERLAGQLQFETQVLARLEHRHIARLYDAGLDTQGQPWIASELIEGDRLDVAAARLDAQALLRLFAWVARAVAYAHGRGVLHRDLKPGNVLVDAEGMPHLLDFGVAALVGGRSAPASGLTPAYAAPEQRMGAAPAARADLYSLGVMAQRLQKPLPRAQQADLAAVLARATAHDPAERYDSATTLAQEFERLQRGEPVLARPLPAAQRWLRRARRQPGLTGLALALLLTLLAGGGMAVQQARQAAEAAERERVVRGFMGELFRFNAEPGRPAQLLDHSSELIATRFEGQPALQAELYGLVGAGYQQMGAPQQAGLLFERRLAQLPAGHAERPTTLMDLAEAQLDQAHLRAAEATLQAVPEPLGGQAPGPAQAQAQRLQLLRTRLAVERGDFQTAQQQLQPLLQAGGRTGAQALGLQAELMERNALFSEFPAAFERAASAADAADDPLAGARWRSLGARLAAQAGLHDKAQALFDAAQATLRRQGGLHQVRAAIEASRFWAASYMRLPRPFDEVNGGLQRAQEELKSLGSHVPQALHDEAASNLGWLQMEWGDVRRAAPGLGAPLVQRLRHMEQPRERLRWLAVAGWAAALQGEHERADALLRERLALRRSAGRGATIFVATDLRFVAINLAMAGQAEAALRLLDEAPPPPQIDPGQADPRWYSNLLATTRARVLLDAGQPDAALAAVPDRPVEPMDAQLVMLNTAPPLLRGEALCAQGNAKPGLALLRRARALLTPAHHPDAPVLARLHALMGLCAWQQGLLDEARQLEQQAGDALQRQQPLSAYFSEPWRRLNQRLAAP